MNLGVHCSATQRNGSLRPWPDTFNAARLHFKVEGPDLVCRREMPVHHFITIWMKLPAAKFADIHARIAQQHLRHRLRFRRLRRSRRLLLRTWPLLQAIEIPFVRFGVLGEMDAGL